MQDNVRKLAKNSFEKYVYSELEYTNTSAILVHNLDQKRI